jgi:predicted tellurium resistance membrane protein TerC
MINLKSKTIAIGVGVVLIIIALILGLTQHFVYNIYGADANKWYFYSLVGIIGLIGIVVAVWGLMKTETPPKTEPTQQAQPAQ